ncbi:MAG: Eco57I restriction-modification methylase domain-containing protein, partial [Thermodesulfobacteriota bacterium]|nr:Eco57I restriction-modification methylase domain-containing protein [Thermodesulfobacteriota bacterium]
MGNLQESVYGILRNLRDLDGLKELFRSQLNYDLLNLPIPRQDWPQGAADSLADDPLLLAGHGDFHVIYGRLQGSLRITPERAVVRHLLQKHPYALFIFSDETRTQWHFANVKLAELRDDEKNRDSQRRRLYRRIKIGPDERLRTASDRLARLDLEALHPGLFGIPPLEIQRRHDEAFDVEAVTKEFYDKYEAILKALQGELAGRAANRREARLYALQFLNRLMFLYFIQRKRWLGNDPEFLRSYWEVYRQSGQPRDTFFSRWLSVLFFEAFNNRFSHPSYLPADTRNVLQMAPYLNGGLFSRNPLDDKGLAVSDRMFGQVFSFFESYNFTIAEDSPFDQEVAVDPEMIGKVYESLVHGSEQAEERGEAGIFYTPRTEIDLMCRLALVDRLANDLGEKRKPLLYEAVFAFEAEEKDAANAALARQELWPEVARLLQEITVLDPACGSGSFLVGMLTILNDLNRRANAQLGVTEDDYSLKKRIIGQNLYGVDVMDWAVQVAELRLWLHLIVDTDIPEAERKIDPLLPNLSFKVRCGDSLVQEVAGIILPHPKAKGSGAMLPPLRKRLNELKRRKLAYYAGVDHPEVEKTGIEQEEFLLFRDLLQHRRQYLDNEGKILRHKIATQKYPGLPLPGDLGLETPAAGPKVADWSKRLEDIASEMEALKQSQENLRNRGDVPFAWDLDFVEIFSGDRRGFDVVIGNPPYVRQESIIDPNLSREAKEEMTADELRDQKKAYKAKLAQAVYQAFPRFFGYSPKAAAPAHKLDAKSDLYIYFYFHGLSLLNPKGAFCFITSNSWLDVGYGKDLQEFLLKHAHVKLILDNQAKRSFSAADVNTVIALFSAPNDKTEWGRNKAARFVMFKLPFEQIISPVIFEEIEEAQERKLTLEYRIFPIPQQVLLQEGLEVAGEEESEETTQKRKKAVGPLIKVARYIGNKWGGKYLRAPDIFYTVLEKGREKLLRLGNITEVRPGCYSGINDFFYLSRYDANNWGIEDQFLRPIIRSPREITRPYIEVDNLNNVVFYCLLTKKELDRRGLKGTLEYINWGEDQVTRQRQKTNAGIPWPKVETVKRRNPGWWAIPENNVTPAKNFLLYVIGERFLSPWTDKPITSDRCFHRIIIDDADEINLAASINCSLSFLFISLFGRGN